MAQHKSTTSTLIMSSVSNQDSSMSTKKFSTLFRASWMATMFAFSLTGKQAQEKLTIWAQMHQTYQMNRAKALFQEQLIES